MTRCHCVVASRTVLWLLFCFVAFGACLVGFISPEWLEGSSSVDDRRTATTPRYSEELAKKQKIGPLKACRLRVVDDVVACVFLTWETFDSAAWKSSVILQGVGTAVVFLALLLGLASFWKQNIGRFNIVSIAGLLEGVAVPLLAAGLAVYPLSWSSATVKGICGDSAGDYEIGGCSVGWALYAMAAGCMLTLLSCLFSPRAARACNSDLVEEKIQLGQSCICVL